MKRILISFFFCIYYANSIFAQEQNTSKSIWHIGISGQFKKYNPYHYQGVTISPSYEKKVISWLGLGIELPLGVGRYDSFPKDIFNPQSETLPMSTYGLKAALKGTLHVGEILKFNPKNDLFATFSTGYGKIVYSRNQPTQFNKLYSYNTAYVGYRRWITSKIGIYGEYKVYENTRPRSFQIGVSWKH